MSETSLGPHVTRVASSFCEKHLRKRNRAGANGISRDTLRGGTTRRLTNRCNGNLTWSFVWLRQASRPAQVPLISNVRRIEKMHQARTIIPAILLILVSCTNKKPGDAYQNFDCSTSSNIDIAHLGPVPIQMDKGQYPDCLLYTSDAADE